MMYIAKHNALRPVLQCLGLLGMFVLLGFGGAEGAKRALPRSVEFLGEISTETGDLNHPEGVAVTPEGEVLVADTGSRAVKKFSEKGVFLGQIGYPDVEFESPVDVWTDGVEVLVLDAQLGMLFSIRNEDMLLLSSLDISGDTRSTGDLTKVGRDRLGRILVADRAEGRLRLLSEKGESLGTIGLSGSRESIVGMTCERTGRILAVGSSGVLCYSDLFGNVEKTVSIVEGDSQEIVDVAVDGFGNVFVLDRDLCRVYVLDPGGRHLLSFGGKGSGRGSFLFPGGIAVTEEGWVCVADTGNSRIVLFRVLYEPNSEKE